MNVRSGKYQIDYAMEFSQHGLQRICKLRRRFEVKTWESCGIGQKCGVRPIHIRGVGCQSDARI
jgi:hypothetical protein